MPAMSPVANTERVSRKTKKLVALHTVKLVTDASKFGRRSLSLIGRIECARRIITDNRLDAETAESLRAKGLKLVIV